MSITRKLLCWLAVFVEGATISLSLLVLPLRCILAESPQQNQASGKDETIRGSNLPHVNLLYTMSYKPMYYNNSMEPSDEPSLRPSDQPSKLVSWKCWKRIVCIEHGVGTNFIQIYSHRANRQHFLLCLSCQVVFLRNKYIKFSLGRNVVTTQNAGPPHSFSPMKRLVVVARCDRSVIANLLKNLKPAVI